jgi:phosphatidylinositol glycan class B
MATTTLASTPQPVPWRAIALVALPPALLAVLQLGRLHPDEIFQALEPAHHFAFGEGMLAWEWHEGLRNWALPGLFGWLLKLCRALGIDDPQGRRAVLELPQYALHLASLGAVYRLVARRLPQSAAPTSLARDPAFWSVLLLGLYAPVLHYAGRTLGEAISTSFLLWGLERVDAREQSRRQYASAGMLLGLAVVVRYGSAVIAVAAVLWLLLARRWRDAAMVAGGGSVVACLLGALDWHSWGRPFHSLLTYSDFNVLSDGAATRFGAEPWWFYGPWLLATAVVWAWPALAIAWRPSRKHEVPAAAAPSGLFLWCAAIYLLAISVIEHKELRFLYPSLVLLAAGAAPGFSSLLQTISPPHARQLLLVSLACGLLFLGFRTDFRPQRTAQFRLFVKAARTGTGLVLLHSGTWAAPGYFYANGRPWMMCETGRDRCFRDATKNPLYNRVIGWRDEGAKLLLSRGFTLVEQRSSATLWARDAAPTAPQEGSKPKPANAGGRLPFKVTALERLPIR